VSGAGAWSQTFEVGKVQDRSHGALRQLWARQRIQLLSDYDQFGQDLDRKAEVTHLGLTYNLLTAYTSFVAVDTQVRNAGGNTTTITQPLPMPEGVSDAAVGGVSYMALASPPPPSPMVMMRRGPAAYALAESRAQDRLDRSLKAKAAPGRTSPSFLGNAGTVDMPGTIGQAATPSLHILSFSGITGTSDPAALRLELEARLMDSALAAALAGLPQGTTLSLQVDGSGHVLAVTFSQSFPGAARAKALISVWRLNSWTGGLAGNLEVTLG